MELLLISKHLDQSTLKCMLEGNLRSQGSRPEADTADHLFPGRTSVGTTCCGETAPTGRSQEPGHEPWLEATCSRGHGEIAAAPGSGREDRGTRKCTGCFRPGWCWGDRGTSRQGRGRYSPRGARSGSASTASKTPGVRNPVSTPAASNPRLPPRVRDLALPQTRRVPNLDSESRGSPCQRGPWGS